MGNALPGNVPTSDLFVFRFAEIERIKAGEIHLDGPARWDRTITCLHNVITTEEEFSKYLLAANANGREIRFMEKSPVAQYAEPEVTINMNPNPKG